MPYSFHSLGPVVNSYSVSDKTQEAEIDPAMYMDELDDPDSRPCPICNSNENEDVILLCDGCDAGYHTYCVDLDAVPDSAWHCGECIVNGVLEPRGNHIPTPRARVHGPHTRSQQRALRLNTQVTSASDWARVWRSVWDRLEIDLDFPFDDDAAAAQYRRSQQSTGRGRRRFRAWERRLQVAQQQGAGERFEDSADALLERPVTSRPRPEPPEPESAEELLAWNALEKARDIEADPSPKSRKRKSTTNSPSEPSDGPRRKKRKRSATSSPTENLPAPIPERKFKRPQTRRALEPNDSSGPEASNSRTISTNGNANGEGPSFLQSLLDEVESSAGHEEPQTNGRANIMISNPNSHSPSDHPSPQYSSSAASPTTSNHPSPRAMSASPPPLSNGRPGSPAPLTSKIEPVYPPAPDLSHETPLPISSVPRRPQRSSKSQTRVGRWAVETASSSSPSRPRSEESSPTRSMSFSAKENLQRLVKSALKTPYKDGRISKDQYTDINRSVSHILYDKVGEDGELNDHNEDALKKMAHDEVEKALQEMQVTSS